MKIRNLVVIAALAICGVASAEKRVRVVDLDIYKNQHTLNGQTGKFGIGDVVYRNAATKVRVTEDLDCDSEFPGDCSKREILESAEVLQFSVVYTDPEDWTSDDRPELIVNFPISKFPAEVVQRVRDHHKSCLFCDNHKIRRQVARDWLRVNTNYYSKDVKIIDWKKSVWCDPEYQNCDKFEEKWVYKWVNKKFNDVTLSVVGSN